MRDEDGVPKGFVVVIRDLRKSRLAEERLAQINFEWLQAMDQLDDVVYMVDMQRHLVRANHAFYQSVGSDAEHCVGMDIADLVHPGVNSQECTVCQAGEAVRDTSLTMESNDRFNFTGVPVEVTLKTLHDKHGNATGILASFHDLSQVRDVKERLRLAASVFEGTADGITITDKNGNIVDVNRAFTEITGYSKSEVLGKNPRILQSGRNSESFYRDMWRTIEQVGYWNGEIWNRHKNGELIPENLTISSLVDEDGLAFQYIGVFSDISQIKRSQEKLDHLAHHDALTDLPNRLLLQERLEQAIKHAQRNRKQLAVIFVDLDHFKLINDSFGHPVGDLVLKEVAEYLQSTMREGDTVARIGGDEFVLLLEDIGQAETVGVVARKILEVFQRPVKLEEREININASLGICIYPRDGTSPEELMSNADAAMYRAKDQGRNNFQFYTEELTRNAIQRVMMENDLRHAIARDELRVLYQPQLNLGDGSFIGMEALVRWQHPDLGMVSPASFIPLAEETGLIHSVGEWVLRTACIQGKTWLDRGINFGRISVNVAGPQIQRGGLPNIVAKVLVETGMPATHLELEVTEGFIMRQAEFAIDQLQALRDQGVSLAIDDFGTGYSSLSYLKLLPIDKLKIDQSFIRDIPHDENDKAISNAVIALGNSLGLTVIAEGVETKEQAAFLKQAGCAEVQGYLYSRPIDAEALELYIAGLERQ